MEITSLYQGLDLIESVGGSNSKTDVTIQLLKYVKNAELFFKLAMNDDVYGVAEQTFKNAFPEYNNTHDHISDWLGETDLREDTTTTQFSTLKVSDLQIFLNRLKTKSGYEQTEFISHWFRGLSKIKRKWFCRAVLKDLRCGVQLTTINLALRSAGLSEIEKYAVQLCQKVDLYNPKDVAKKLRFPCSMECKYDGIRLQAEVIPVDDFESQVILTSRRGTDRTSMHPDLVVELGRVFAGQHVILDGEIISRSFQDLTRKDSTAVQKYIIFDILNDERLPYRHRWDNLMTLASDVGILPINHEELSVTDVQENQNNNNIIKHLFTAEHYSCNNIEDAQKYYEDLNRRKEEGIIIKLDDRPYERNAKKKVIMNMYKCKKVYDADLKIVGYKWGEGKRSNLVSTLCLEDASGTIKVDVGSGIDDFTAQELTEKLEECVTGGLPEEECLWMYSIVEIHFNERTETGSLRFPRFIRFREDKTEPDDLTKMDVRQE